MCSGVARSGKFWFTNLTVLATAESPTATVWESVYLTVKWLIGYVSVGDVGDPRSKLVCVKKDAQSYQYSRNPEAGSAVTEGAYEQVAACKQNEGSREVRNEGGVNARTGAGDEKQQEVLGVDHDQGSHTRMTEFDDHQSVVVSRRCHSPDSRKDRRTGRLSGSEDGRRRSGIAVAEEEVVRPKFQREGLRPRAFSTPQKAGTVRQRRSGFSVGGSPSQPSLKDPELE
ncbi:hypothetical protein OUZ56_010071 [Daphnia magna]|uniref:Uncharacterized protein n=1 Tax=Daphnia magna TaxID=35525 RepID=A0ABR0AHP7_9CRUS|nr:hypothetical protein OUZ56_010071 [Daphnia magna]